MSIRRGVLLFTLVVLSCGESRQHPAVERITESASIAPSAEARTQPFVKVLSFANYRKNTLEYCADMTLTVTPPDIPDPGWRPEKTYDLRDALENSGVEIKKSCSEQFGERPVYATCTATLKKAFERSELKILEQYYDSDAIGLSNRHMKECLQVGGEWKVIARVPTKSREIQLDDALRTLRESTRIN